MKYLRHRWSDKYGSQWYKYFDGKPPLDDENSYVWNVASQQWERDWEYDEGSLNDKESLK